MGGGERGAPAGLLIGALASGFALLVSFVLGWQGVAFAPASAGQALIEILPGFVTVPLIELLKEWAKRFLILALVGSFLGSGTLAGRWAVDPRRGSGATAALVVGP